jgi:hypothetical protein
MLHCKAKPLLLQQMDEALPESVAVELEVHVASCARCRQLQREYECSELLLIGMPATVAPLQFDPVSYTRLKTLTRWSATPQLPRRDRYNAPILALASAAAIFMMAAGLSHWSPIVRPVLDPVTTVSYQPDSAYMTATWSPSRF